MRHIISTGCEMVITLSDRFISATYLNTSPRCALMMLCTHIPICTHLWEFLLHLPLPAVSLSLTV